MDRYEHLKDIGAGNFGVARLMRDKKTKELVAIKYIERGDKIDHNVEREIINHRSLRHPNIVRFKEVCLTNSHLAIVMEYAAGGELFDRICAAGRFTEDEARFFFQQLISGVSYCHAMAICHRDLKLENTLLDGSPAPRLKICDFGYSKSALLNSAPKSIVGTPAYIAPEVLSSQGYDGKTADVWSCGVTLYVMLVGAYPFEDADDPKNFRRTIERIVNVQYTIPSYIKISQECRNLLACIFVATPAKRITIPEIMQHPWFIKNLPRDLYLGSDPNYNQEDPDHPLQSIDEVKRILAEARTKPEPHRQPVLVQPQSRNPETHQQQPLQLQQKTQQLQQITQQTQVQQVQQKVQKVHLQQKVQQLQPVHLQQKIQQSQPVCLPQQNQQPKTQPWPQLVIEKTTLTHQETAVIEEEDELEYFECSDFSDFESNEPMRDQDSSAEPTVLQSSKKSLLSLISFGDWIPQKLSINNFRLTSWFR